MSFIDIEKIDLSQLDDKITVEEFLNQQCQMEMQKVREHSEEIIAQFKKEAEEVRKKLEERLNQNQ